MRLLVTRPEEDAEPLAATLKAMGHDVLVAPLLSIHFLRDVPIPDERWQAILFTSANGVRALAARREAPALAATPVLAVGEASAGVARAAGFQSVVSAAGDVAALAALAARRLVPGDGPLLHVAGSIVAGDLGGTLEKAGFSVVRLALYEARAATGLPESVSEALKAGLLDGVLFHSPRTARNFAALLRHAGLQDTVSRLTAYCLSPAVADALAGLPFAALSVAATPDQTALLALLPG